MSNNILHQHQLATVGKPAIDLDLVIDLQLVLWHVRNAVFTPSGADFAPNGACGGLPLPSFNARCAEEDAAI